MIDASNIQQGGALQSASSVIDEITTLLRSRQLHARYPWMDSLQILMSAQVKAEMTVEPTQFEVVSRRWHSPSLWRRGGQLPEVYTTVFGPAYGVRRGRITISGFADGTSISPDPTLSAQPRARRIKRRLRARASRYFFARQDLLYAEADRIAADLSRVLRYERSRIDIIANTPNGVLTRPELWLDAPLPERLPGTFDVGFVSRWYPHKNFDLLGQAAAILAERGITVRFILTLRPDEIERLDAATRAASHAVGALSIRQVPSVYQHCDAMIFPSLMESSSAAPLESLRLNGHLVASDRDFVRVPCGPAPVYFEPTDARSCADALEAMLTDPQVRARSAQVAREIAGGFPSPRTRAEALLTLIDKGVHMPR